MRHHPGGVPEPTIHDSPLTIHTFPLRLGRAVGFAVRIAALALLTGAAAFPRLAEAQSNGISAGLINVIQNDTSNNTESVTVTCTVAINGFFIRDGSTRGDYFVQVGAGFSDDVDSGVMMSSIAQNGRDNGETNYPGMNYCTSTMDYSRSGGNAGGLYVSSFQAPSGAEYNINTAAAFFSYSNWIGGFARNSGTTNGGANDLFTGSPGLVLGTHFVDNGGGNSTVNLTSLGIDSRTNGILLVTHGKNEDNYASSMVNSNNGTWTVFIKDNGTDAGSYEQDPVAFVYIPRTNTTVVSGRFRGDGTILMYSGASPQFAVTNTATGTWRLTIPGQSPASGVLIISAEGGLAQNQDNIVSYEPDNGGWIIQSRDLPASPPGLQTPGGGSEPVASFVFIPAPATATLLSPANDAQNVPTTVTLQAVVSNNAAGNLTLTYYGRPAGTNNTDDFEMIALPDTQFYVSSLNGGVPGMFYSQTEWIITNRFSRNIAYVAQLGDITQNGDLKSGGGSNLQEWLNSTNAMYRVENPARTGLSQGIPYGVAVGNHDEEPIGDSTGTTTFYNQYFGISHFTGKSYYAGHLGSTNNNHFDFFSAGGMDFITLYFEYDETLNTNILAWGNAVLATNHNRRAIIVTHNFGGTATPLSFSPQGQAIYNMAKVHTNVFMMLAGHVTGQGSRTDTFNGNTIHTFVSDYQGWTNGGNGFLRIIHFAKADNQVVFQTYSPWTGEYDTGPGSDVWFNYNMQTAGGGATNAPFVALGAYSNVVPGNVISCVWTGLQNFAAYQWYATVSDDAGNVTTSPVWKFTTVPATPPTVSNTVITVYGDAETNLNLIAYNTGAGSVTFRTNTPPTQGLIRNFNTGTGSFTYSPARNYRGTERFTFSATNSVGSSGVASYTINVISPPDTNADGLPDGWEAAYGITDPNGDADGDGQNNGQEYLAGTNPTNAASLLRITSATRQTNGNFVVSWPSIGGTRYRVQYANAGTNGFPAMIDVTRSLSLEMDAASYGIVSTQTFTDDFTLTAPATNGARFYRIKVIP
jgi:hypothetical protein